MQKSLLDLNTEFKKPRIQFEHSKEFFEEQEALKKIYTIDDILLMADEDTGRLGPGSLTMNLAIRERGKGKNRKKEFFVQRCFDCGFIDDIEFKTLKEAKEWVEAETESLRFLTKNRLFVHRYLWNVIERDNKIYLNKRVIVDEEKIVEV